MEKIIGREKEKALLDSYFKSGKSEFVAVYGRRRVGKTFLIRNYFDDKFDFYYTGTINGTKEEQLKYFSQALQQKGMKDFQEPTSWAEAFFLLQQLLAKKVNKKKRCLIFIDELPCLDTPRSGFINALDHFWNSWGSAYDNVMLVVCGSATSWIVKNLIDNHGGLHNRITHEIYLSQFSLKETEMYLKAKKFNLSRTLISQIYMALGGVPYYLNLLDEKLSVAQNFDNLFFGDKATLKNEFDRLYKSLFKEPELYIKIIQILTSKKSGMTRSEICDALKKKSGSQISNILSDLENCDFIRSFHTREKKIKKNLKIYQVTDFFTIFYITFCHRGTTEPEYWSKNVSSPKINNWYGLAFERLCFAHISQIKQAIGIHKIYCEYYSWRSKEQTTNSQIDLVIERADKMVNICEIKYSNGPYGISRDEDMKIRTRLSDFKAETGINNGILFTMITTYGLKPSKYNEIVNSQVVIDNLFL